MSVSHISRATAIFVVDWCQFDPSWKFGLNIWWTPLIVYHSRSDFPLQEYVCEEEKRYKYQIIFKGDNDGRTVDCAKFFESIFHWWCHSPVATFFLWILAYVYRVVFKLPKKCLWMWLWSSLCICTKFFYSNSDNNQ